MMNQQEIDDLFSENVNQISAMNISSGSMIKTLLMGIDTNGPAYIRLSNAKKNGYKVDYTHVDGDQSLVKRVGESLGLIITDTTLEVRS